MESTQRQIQAQSIARIMAEWWRQALATGPRRGYPVLSVNQQECFVKQLSERVVHELVVFFRAPLSSVDFSVSVDYVPSLFLIEAAREAGFDATDYLPIKCTTRLLDGVVYWYNTEEPLSTWRCLYVLPAAEEP